MKLKYRKSLTKDPTVIFLPLSQVMQTKWTSILAEHASLQPALTTLSRCGTSDPIRCYSTTKV